MKPLLYLFILLFSASGCAFVKLETDYNQRADFSSYQTFCWLQGCEFVYLGPEYFKDFNNIELIREAVVDELVEKGFRRDENQPDFLIDFRVIAEERTAIVRSFAQESLDGERAWAPFGEQETRYYIEGSLVIDVIDARTSQIVWRSYGVQYFEHQDKISDKKIRRAVKAALRKFPPGR
jgi:hypothetical protein